MSFEEWRNRWEVFSDNGCGFGWYGIDSKGNLAKFTCDESFVPETFFQDTSVNKKLKHYFDNLSEITNAKLPENIRPVLRKLAERDRQNPILKLWNPLKQAQRGIFIFSEATDKTWYEEGHYKQYINSKNPYELLAIPKQCLKFSDLPNEIQELLKPYQFENLEFENCQFLDVSKYLYCEH